LTVGGRHCSVHCRPYRCSEGDHGQGEQRVSPAPSYWAHGRQPRMPAQPSSRRLPAVRSQLGAVTSISRRRRFRAVSHQRASADWHFPNRGVKHRVQQLGGSSPTAFNQCGHSETDLFSQRRTGGEDMGQTLIGGLVGRPAHGPPGEQDTRDVGSIPTGATGQRARRMLDPVFSRFGPTGSRFPKKRSPVLRQQYYASLNSDLSI
jgi:hypothetical protein